MLPEDQSKVARPLVVLEGLFPFPKDMCPRMEMVNLDSVEQSDEDQGGMMPIVDGSMDWIFDEFNLDYLDIPFLG